MSPLRTTLHAIRHRPALALAVVLTLGIGLGATTTVFTMVDALLLKPLPYPEPHRLVAVFETSPETDRRGAAPANFLDWRRDAHSLTELAAWFTTRRTLEGSAGAERVMSGSVSANFFATLGAAAAIGRTFLPAEDGETGANLAVLGNRIWRRQFGADPTVVGRTVRIDEQPFQIVGIMPATFAAPEAAELWTLGDQGVPALGGFAGELTAKRDIHYFSVIGRLAPGADLAAARAELSAIAARLAMTFPATNQDLGINVVSLRDAIIGDRNASALLLLGVVGLVLLIAGANTANLMLTASASRTREFAVRAALGATRRQLAGQLVLEGVGLAVLAGMLGLAGTVAAVRVLASTTALALPEVTRASVDGRIFLFALVLALLVGLGTSLFPALRAGGGSVGTGLRVRGTAGTAHAALRRGLAVFQLGLSLTLLVGAGLLLRGYRTLTQTDPGFAAEGVVTMDVALSRASYPDPAQVQDYYQRALAAATALSGVTHAAAISSLPVGGGSMNRGLRIEGRPEPERVTDQTIEYQVATPGYLEAMAIPLLAGRTITSSDDAQAPLVAVITEAARRAYWANQDPIGTRIGFGRRDGTMAWPTIVGIVADVRHFGLDQAARPEVYVPMAQDPSRGMTLILRSTTPAQTLRLARDAARAVDPTQPVAAATLLTDQLAGTVARPRFLSRLLGAFAGMALMLASVGLYGLLAQLVLARTREIGVRLALGAQPMQMMAMVLHDAARLVGMGILLGVLGAVGLTRLLGTLLFGVSPTDPSVFLGTVGVLSAVAFAAAALPARRAARLDPATVLQRPE